MITLILRFLEDTGESFQHRESEALLVETIPRRGEAIAINDRFHAVARVIHNYDADGIEIHLGPGGESSDEALAWFHRRKSEEGDPPAPARDGRPPSPPSAADYKGV